ncbi:MAG TPA: DUF4388 domain-containing protein [Polyangia bacterium]
MQGDVSTMPVRELLGMLARTRATGRLSISRAMEARRFHLREGRVILASSSEPKQLLGKLLVDRGLLDQAQLARALKSRPTPTSRLGRTLSKEGLVPAKALAQVLADKIERLLNDFLTWQDGQFHFDPGVAAEPEEVQTGVSASVDLEALLRRHAEQAAKTWVVADADVIEAIPLRPAPVAARRRRRTSASA